MRSDLSRTLLFLLIVGGLLLLAETISQLSLPTALPVDTAHTPAKPRPLR